MAKGKKHKIINIDMVNVQTVTLTDAQIKALPTTPIEVVSAQGAGKGIIPIKIVMVSDFSTAAYTNVSSAAWDFIINQPASSIYPAEGILISQRYIITVPTEVTYNGVNDFDGYIVGAWQVTPAEADNMPLILRDDWNGGDYTGGNAANTLKVTVYYVVVDL